MIKLTAVEALKAMPEQYAEVVAKILKKGKHDLRSYAWELKTAQTIDNSLREAKTIEQQLAIRVKNTCCFLEAKVKHSRFSSDITKTVPQIVIDEYRKRLEESEKEQQRVDKLSPAERDKEVESLLKQLRGPGFVELRVGR